MHHALASSQGHHRAVGQDPDSAQRRQDTPAPHHVTAESRKDRPHQAAPGRRRRRSSHDACQSPRWSPSAPVPSPCTIGATPRSPAAWPCATATASERRSHGMTTTRGCTHCDTMTVGEETEDRRAGFLTWRSRPAVSRHRCRARSPAERVCRAITVCPCLVAGPGPDGRRLRHVSIPCRVAGPERRGGHLRQGRVPPRREDPLPGVVELSRTLCLRAEDPASKNRAAFRKRADTVIRVGLRMTKATNVLPAFLVHVCFVQSASCS